jgi:hypothetical protein
MAETVKLLAESFQFAVDVPLECFQFAVKKGEEKQTQSSFRHNAKNMFLGENEIPNTSEIKTKVQIVKVREL